MKRKILVLAVVTIALIVIISFFRIHSRTEYQYEELYLEKDNLLFCFSISRFGGGPSTYYQVGKDGTLLRAEGYAESEYITDRGYFLTYEEVIAGNSDASFRPDDLGIKYDEIKISAEEVKELELLLYNCVSNVEGGAELIDNVHTQRLVHSLFCDGKVYYEWADSRGYVKDPLSLVGYKLEELCGIEEIRYKGDFHYYDDVKSFLTHNEEFTSKYRNPKNVSGARDWPIKRDNNGENWRPFVVETRKYQMVVYIRFGGANPNGEIYMYEFEVEEISKK